QQRISLFFQRYYSQEWFSGERVHVPCVSCGGLHSCPSRLGFVGSQLTCLNLNGNHLQSIPAEIGCLRGLQVLSLEKNQLTELPETLGSLTELHCLDISHNTFKHIPSFISKLVRLEELHLSHNVIQLIPPEISRLKLLLILDIRLSFLPCRLGLVSSISRLEVIDNQLSYLPYTLSNLQGSILLKDMLQNAGCCSICQSPVFEVHEAEIVPVTFNPYSFTVPLLKQVCSQHVV
ncbi:SHOC2-like protein, partial [Mya arenaria]